MTVGPDGVVRKKRGRKPGTKAKSNWSRPGPKAKNMSVDIKCVVSILNGVCELSLIAHRCLTILVVYRPSEIV